MKKSKKPADAKAMQAAQRLERVRFTRLVGKVKPSGKLYKRDKRHMHPG